MIIQLQIIKDGQNLDNPCFEASNYDEAYDQAMEWLQVRIDHKTFGEHHEPWTEQVVISDGYVDEETGEYVEAIYDEVEHPADFTYEITDVTDAMNQAKINDEARAYLASTDWYVIRFQETGKAIPEDVLLARQAARSQIV